MSLRYAILGSLAQEPASGYDLVKRFDRTINFVWWASHGAVYTELQKLEAEGLIEQSESGGRGRILNVVTEAGWTSLRQWLSTEPARRPRDEHILRIFSLWVAEPEEAASFLDKLADRYGTRLAEYERRAEAAPEPSSPAELFAQIALRAGIANERAMLAWATESVDLVRKQLLSGGEG